MLLAIDVGNSNVVLALLDGETLLESWRLHTNVTHTTDDWWIVVKHLAEDARVDITVIDGAIISSVVPVAGQALLQMCQRYLRIEPLRVHAHLPLDLGLDVKDPDSVGADRICNVVAAREVYGTPCIIVDLGTATTFDVVNEAGHTWREPILYLNYNYSGIASGSGCSSCSVCSTLQHADRAA